MSFYGEISHNCYLNLYKHIEHKIQGISKINHLASFFSLPIIIEPKIPDFRSVEQDTLSLGLACVSEQC